MKTLFCLLFFLGMIPLAAIAENEEIERLLLKLDSLIAQKEIIEKKKNCEYLNFGYKKRLFLLWRRNIG